MLPTVKLFSYFNEETLNTLNWNTESSTVIKAGSFTLSSICLQIYVWLWALCLEAGQEKVDADLISGCGIIFSLRNRRLTLNLNILGDSVYLYFFMPNECMYNMMLVKWKWNGGANRQHRLGEKGQRLTWVYEKLKAAFGVFLKHSGLSLNSGFSHALSVSFPIRSYTPKFVHIPCNEEPVFCA